MKILWLSNAPFASTGYGNQTRLFVPRIRDLGHEIAVCAFYGLEGGQMNLDGIHIFPKGRHPYGVDVAPDHAKAFGADVIISLIDAWVMDYQALQSQGAKWIPWYPVDSEPIAPPVRDQVSRAYRRIVFSRFGERMTQEAGLDCYYVPHGIDTNLFRPVDRAVSRKRFKFPEDVFLVGMVAANKGYPPRKAFYENIGAFAELKKRHDDVLLYLHTSMGITQGVQEVNLLEYCEHVGLQVGKDVLFANPYQYSVGYPDLAMVDMYNAFDVHLLVSMGEGFGIPQVEAQACGCPVIAGAWTASEELMFSGWKVDRKDALPFRIPLGADQFLPRKEAILEKLEMAYRMRGNNDYRKWARDGALRYDADKVAEKYWKTVLSEIEQDISTWSKPAHTHEWIQTGLYNPDGSMSVPCKTCGAELRISRNNERMIIANGFANPHDLKFIDPDGLEWLLMREVERDYRSDELNLNKSSVVVDIGAHVGVVSMSLAKQYGCQVYAFEPEPENYRRLVANIKANGLSDLITHFHLAVTGDARNVKISTDQANSGGGNIYGGEGVEVESTTLQRIFKATGFKVDLLKIDCEGAEYEILQGADGLLANVSAIRGEFHPLDGYHQQELLESVKAIVPNTRVTLLGVAA